MRYREDIDGLRALAVLPVIFFHFNISAFAGGFVGVDVFFVISGYLITGLILSEIKEERFSFYDFYERRARRLAPAAFTVLLFSSIASWFVLISPEDMAAFGKSLWATMVFASNFIFMKEAGYFDLPSQVKPLLHTWSLAVEEQFYIVFPVIALFVMTFFRTHLKIILLLLCVLSFCISVVTVTSNQAFAFYMLPSRAWELLIGALLAAHFFPTPQSKFLQNFAGVTGLLLILFSIAYYSKSTLFPGIAALPPVLGTAMIIWANSNSKCAVGTILSWRPLVFTGLLSYSLYLWHWPLTVFTKYHLNRDLAAYEIALLLMVIFALSYLTWRYIEQPVRQRRFVFKRPAFVFSLCMIGGVIFITYGQVAQQTKGMAFRLPEQAQQFTRGAWDKNPDTKKCHNIPPEDIARFKLCVLGQNTSQTPDFIVWGDSHANTLMPLFKSLARDKKLYGVQASHSACIPLVHPDSDHRFDRKCAQFNQAMLDIIIEKKIPNVILSGRWMGRIPVFSPKYKKSIRHTLEQLKSQNVWIFTDTPIHRKRIPSELARAVVTNRDIETLGAPSKAYKATHERIQRAFTDNTSAPFKFIDASSILCGSRSHCRVQHDGNSLYYDSHHLSTYGAMYIREAFEEAFDSMKNSRTEKETARPSS